ncbi:MAG TPA: MBL fold metallo-hydrolase [Steroidobacteraceae bacterium]|nr:MBL fold metallo-hydrolase [Steroidobacteraceae bacterium]
MTAHFTPARLTRHPDGITAVDTEYIRPGLAAAHIVEHGGGAAFVDVGTNYSVPHLLAALQELAISPQDVDYVFITHVHLDHAGGAGRLLQSLPRAKIVLHPRGAPHLIDPAKLIAASMKVYGDERYRELYGELVPLPAERVITSEDGQRLELRGRPFELLHTPGHALHHYCLVDLAHRNIFTGDTFGLSYRELDTAQGAFGVPTTTPSQFDPTQLIASIDRLMATEPRAAYLMHYSRVTGLPAIAASLKAQIPELAAIALRHADAGDPYAAIYADMRALWIRLAARHGLAEPAARVDEYLSKDLDLNTQGLIFWLQRQRR